MRSLVSIVARVLRLRRAQEDNFGRLLLEDLGVAR